MSYTASGNNGHSAAAKSVACSFCFRFDPERLLLSWAALFEYRQIFRGFSGAKVGKSEPHSLLLALTDLLSKLKEPVTVQLTTHPGIPHTIIKEVFAARPEISVLSNKDFLPPALTIALDEVEDFARDVLSRHQSLALLGAAIDVLGVEEDWIPIARIDGYEECRVDIHKSHLFPDPHQMDLLAGNA